MNNNVTPFLSVCCITFNHAHYIRECLDGFIIQKTNFPIEILIYDDASTDGAQDIIREYERNYPDIIKPIYQTENQYSKGVKVGAVYNYSRAKGKYIALCEGDDYWTDPLKLQKQVDFLEANPEYGMCYAMSKHYNQVSKKFGKDYGKQYNAVCDLMLHPNYIPTHTVLINKSILNKYLTEIGASHKWKMGDYPLWLFVLGVSKMYLMRETTGVYRKLSNSATNFKGEDHSRYIEFVKSEIDCSLFFCDYFNLSLHKDVQTRFVKSIILKTIKNTSHREICKYIELYQIKGWEVTLYKWLLRTPAGCTILKRLLFMKTNILKTLVKLRDKILN